MRQVTVFCTTSVEGWHAWPDAPEHYAYLRNSHRHMFGVRAEIGVTELDRQIEFIELKHVVAHHAHYIVSVNSESPAAYSCETMADYIVRQIVDMYPEAKFIRVTVDEDGENGATVEWSRDKDGR